MSDQAAAREHLRLIRESARRARRLALGLSNGDRHHLLAHAQDLERQALEIEQNLATEEDLSPQAVTQVQVQQQQQQETEPQPDPDDGKPNG